MGNKTRMYLDVMALNPEVTGSCLLCILKMPNKEVVRFVVDCGLFQKEGEGEGEEYKNLNYTFPFDAENIDFALITHNHVDHVARLPLLYRQGFNGKTYCSNQTKIFLPLSLHDSCKVLSGTCKRKHIKPLYIEKDIDYALANTIGVNFGSKTEITPNINVTFLKNGHLIGAAMILVEIKYPGQEDINILFSGDYNNKNTFFEVDEIPEEIKNKRMSLIIESTYGYMDSSSVEYVFEENLLNSIKEEKTVIVPVFSLGRAQEILLKLKKLQEEELLDKNIPIFFDGNLAHNYTNMYLKNDQILTEERRDFLPENLTRVDSDFREKLLNTDDIKIIVTTSGMGNYGPSQVYLPYFISKKNAAIHFTGYTAEGTSGRKVIEAAKGEKVKIGGLLVKKNADVFSTSEFSGHAKADELLDLIKQFKDLSAVIVNHGEESKKELFANRIIDEINPSYVGIANREFFFRISSWGIEKTLSTKF